jgi:hypothetical protein
MNAIENLFLALDRKDPENFRKAAERELSQELYGKLREEVVLAAHGNEALRGVLSEVRWKLVPDEPADQESAKEQPAEKAQT